MGTLRAPRVQDGQPQPEEEDKGSGLSGRGASTGGRQAGPRQGGRPLALATRRLNVHIYTCCQTDTPRHP